VAALPGSGEVACALMRGESARAIVALNSGSSRHDELLPRILKLLRLATEGHRGIALELEALRLAFVSAVTARGEGQRTSAQARSEWQRALDGGVGQIKANTPELIWRDPCRPPFSAELLAEGARRRAVALLGHRSGTDDPTHDEESEGERTSWLPIATWSEAADGKMSGVGPTDLRRADGALLWYPGRINGLLGPSESGKSWVALLAVSQAVRRGGNVVILDFEDSAGGMAERLLSLGLSAEELKDHVQYISPDEPLTDESAGVLRRFLAEVRPDLVILDGLNAAMTLMGLDLLNNKDVTSFYHRLMHLLVETGATVGYVDHTPKNDTEMASKGGIGAQAKRAMTTGAALRVEVVEHFDRAHPGKLKLWVDKDRTGHVRLKAVDGLIATVRAVPGEDGALELSLLAPRAKETDGVGNYVDPLMTQISEFLAAHGPSSKTQVRAHFPLRASKVDAALEQLIGRGNVERHSGKGTTVLHTLRDPYPSRLSGPSGTSSDRGQWKAVPTYREGRTDRNGTAYELWPEGRAVDVELPDPADDPGAEG